MLTTWSEHLTTLIIIISITKNSKITTKYKKQLILKEINPQYSLEGLMLKLKHQYFGYLMPRVNLLKKTLMLGKIEGRRGRG